MAIAKPPGRIVIPGRGGAAAGEAPLREELQTQLRRPLLVVHRLDRGTSGVLLFATDAESHRRLSRAFERHQVVKHYWALVRGRLMGEGTIERPLLAIRGGLVRVARAGESGGKPSRTDWRAIERVADFTIVDFRPATGRLHQIRAHAAALGHPLAVDPDYGGADRLVLADILPTGPRAGAASSFTLERTPLHAWTLKFPHPRTGDAQHVEAPLPEDLTLAVEALRPIALPPPNS